MSDSEQRREPTVVAAPGYSKSRPDLYRDKDAWLLGDKGKMQTVCLTWEWRGCNSYLLQGPDDSFMTYAPRSAIK